MKNRLREMREASGLSQMALAVRAGSTPAWLTCIERYGHCPQKDLRQRLADVLGVAEREIWPELPSEETNNG